MIFSIYRNHREAIVRRREFLSKSLTMGLVLPAASSFLHAPPSSGRKPLSQSAGKVLSGADLEDIVRGCSYLSCGGGGTLRAALKIVRRDLRDGLEFRLLSVEDLADDEYTATPYTLGSSAPPSEEMAKRFEGLPRLKEMPVAVSFRLLEQHLGKTFAAVTVGELGPESAAESLSVAAQVGVPALDADTVGRATPEVDQYSLLAAGVPTVPAAAVSPFGDEIILTKAARFDREEQILRAVSVVSMNYVGVTDGALPGQVAKRPGVLVTGSISRAGRIGAVYRFARKKGEDPIRAILAEGQGYRLFEGQIEEADWRDEGGFLLGELTIAGTGQFGKSRYRIAFKNEHLIAWRDGEVDVLPPDLISLIDSPSGEAIANPEFERGMKVVVGGFRAPDLWRTPKGLDLFGPRHFGYEHDYVPIEDLRAR
jgi:DUF917 family protein